MLRSKTHFRIIVAYNQVTISVATGMAASGDSKTKNFVLYDAKRCDVSMLVKLGVYCVPLHHRWSLIWVLIRCRLSGLVEACLPHLKFRSKFFGVLVRCYLSICTRVSVVDDGLDTLRNQPNNIRPGDFRVDSLFYTFPYGFKLGAWLDQYQIVGLGDFSSFINVDRPRFIFDEWHNLFISSYPLDGVLNSVAIGTTDSVFYAHSNVNKGCAQCAMPIIKGGRYSIEKSIERFSGRIHVGESMVTVYALLAAQPSYRLIVYVDRAHQENLQPFVRLVASKPFASICWC